MASLFVIGSVVGGVLSLALAERAAAAPNNTISYYIAPANGKIDAAYVDAIRKKGKALGQSVAAGSFPNHRVNVILDFGGMRKKAVWGFVLHNSLKTWLPLRYARNLAEAYARGFYEGTRDDPPAFLSLIVGTNNSRNVTNEGGKALANNVVDIGNAWLRNHGPTNFRFSRQAHMHGGNDIEAPYSLPSGARAWATGYRDNAGTNSFWVFYGDCNGCPQGRSYTTFTGSTVTGPRGWTVDDEYAVAFGLGRSRMIPQSYRTDGGMAAQWESMAEHSRFRKARLMLFRGSLSQHYAGLTGGIVAAGQNATADQAWTLLNEAINGTSRFSGRTAPSQIHVKIRYSTDIGYKRSATKD